MSQALAMYSRPLALELHALLRDLDPSRWDGVEAAARARIAQLEAQLSGMLSSKPDIERSIAERLDEIALLLRERVPSEDLPRDVRDDAWQRFRKQLSAAYEALGVALDSWSVQVPSLRPTNYTRSAVHALISVTLLVLVEEYFTRPQLWIIPLCVASVFWVLEGLRHFNDTARAFLLWIFNPIAHPHERYRVNSSTWFASALLIIGSLYEPMVCALALVVLGLADPAAALVGRRWGNTKLVNNRSLEGSITFAIVGTLASLVTLAIWHADLSWQARLLVALGASVPAALAELASGRIDDNLSIPVAAATGAYLATLLLG
jgi:dolichol kinase